MSWSGTPARLSNTRRYRRCEPLVCRYSQWSDQSSLFDNTTPSSLNVSVRSIAVLSMVTGGGATGLLEKEIIISFVFSALIVNKFLADHSTAWSVTTWIKLLPPSAPHTSHRLLPSTYLTWFTTVCRSLICSKKLMGPTRVPCGTPALTCDHFDRCWPSLTRCLR